MKKHYFEEFKEQISDEHEKYKTHTESTEIPTNRCDHKGKVKMVGGKLVCACGAGWQGPQIDVLYKMLK